MPVRWLGRGRPRGTQPRTIMGLFLRAAMMRDADTRDRLAEQLNGGSNKGWNYDEAAVVLAACQVAARRYFGSGYDVRQITETVSFLREADLAGGKVPHGQLEMEAVIRVALGEADIDVSGINVQEALEIQGTVAGLIAAKLGYSEREISELITEAERIAFARGWNPPLAA